MKQQPVARVSSVRIDAEERGPAAVRFDLGEPAGAAMVRLDVLHALGVTTGTVPAGAAEVAIDLRALPAGPAELRVTAVGADGRDGKPAAISFAVPGRAGTGPVITALAARDANLRRPGKGATAVPRLRIAFREPGAAASAIHLELTRPDGSVEHAHLPPPAGGEGELRPFSIEAAAPIGEYVVRAALVDADGNAGPPATAVFAVGEKGPAAPEVSHAKWRKDGRVVVRGSGFNSPGLLALVDGAPVPIAEASDGQLVLVAGNHLPASVEIRTDLGAAAAPGLVGPRPTIEIVPAGATVTEGGSAQFHAVVAGVADTAVEWSVNAAAAVAISADGVLAIGHAAPDAVVVRARSAAAGIEAATTVHVAAPQGRGATIGPRGGTSRGAGGVTLTIPAGALEKAAKISVEPRQSRLVQRGVVVGAEVTLTAVDLDRPASLEIPLRVHAEPGSVVDVLHREGGQWIPAGHATVGDTGFTVGLDLSRLPDGIKVTIPGRRPHGGSQALSAAPSIDTVHETPIEEGDTVPLLVTGGNFVPGLTQVSVVRSNGASDARIECRGTVVRADGSALGVTVEVSPLPELGEGSLSDHRLRIDTPAGRAEHPLPITGHDELIVAAGQTVTVSASRRFSELRVDAGGTLELVSTVPPVLIEVLGEAFIEGNVTVVAATGTFGTKGTAGGAGGAGGVGAAPFIVGAGGTGGAGGADGDKNGLAGSAGSSPPGSGLPAGTAGAGGTAGGWGLHPHTGGDGGTGGGAPHPRIPGFQAHSTLAPMLGVGAGGGGGGGGGGEGWVFKFAGGGGGGGGAGGGGVGIAAGQGIRFHGVVMANGGDGGAGGTAGDGLPDPWAYISAGQGGGGGGGGGGTILLQGITDSWGASAVAVSGKQGFHPRSAIQVEERTLLQQALARASTGDIRADGAIVGLARPVATQGPDILYLPNLVSTQPSLDVMGYNATHLKVSGGFGRTRRAITWATNAGLNAETVLCMAPVPLNEGFNEIIAEWMWETYGLPESDPQLDAQVMMTSAAVRKRRVLRLSGTIPYYDFTATVTPTALTVATERTGDITVAVTATQATPLLWSVNGGDEYGTVAAQAGGARYRTPSRVPGSVASVAVASALDPNRRTYATVSVVPGITTAAVAATGTPAIATLPSANCGQTIAIDIPAATYALTNEGFASVPAVEFPVLHAKTGGGCERGIVPIAPTIATGLQSLAAEVPACADPGGWVRVAGHGSARLQIVPEVTSIDGIRASEPDFTVRGSGFACGETQVLADGVLQPASSILSVSCGSIHMTPWPTRGAALVVRTSGGDSAPIAVP